MPGDVLPESRLDAVCEALKRHRQAADRPVSWAISGLSHYLEEAKAALQSARPGDEPAILALREEIQRHQDVLQLAGLQLQLWREDFSSRATPAETYSPDARLKQAATARLLAEA
jgi:hypothetical protein